MRSVDPLFRAGLELSVLHLGLLLASLPVRAGLLPSLVPFAGLFRWAAERLKFFGSDRGGMMMEPGRTAPTATHTRASAGRWSPPGDGPVIPTLPALAALRALADGRIIEAGARPCVGIVDVEAFEQEFAAIG